MASLLVMLVLLLSAALQVSPLLLLLVGVLLELWL
jgi:hypothetical protein